MGVWCLQESLRWEDGSRDVCVWSGSILDHREWAARAPAVCFRWECRWGTMRKVEVYARQIAHYLPQPRGRRTCAPHKAPRGESTGGGSRIHEPPVLFTTRKLIEGFNVVKHPSSYPTASWERGTPFRMFSFSVLSHAYECLYPVSWIYFKRPCWFDKNIQFILFRQIKACFIYNSIMIFC